MSDRNTTGVGRIDVHYVAHLARLQLSEEEVREFQCQLDQIVDYFNELGRVPVEGVEPTAHATIVQNVFREDQVRPGLLHEQVMANAPAHRGGQFVVPKIVE